MQYRLLHTANWSLIGNVLGGQLGVQSLDVLCPRPPVLKPALRAYTAAWLQREMRGCAEPLWFVGTEEGIVCRFDLCPDPE